MLKTISRLLFGGPEEETPEDVKSGEELEEGWLVVSHQEAEPAEKQEVEPTDSRPSNSANMAADVSGSAPQEAAQSCRAVDALSAPQPKALLTVAHQLTCIQKAKAWAEPHHRSRHAMQRRNRVRQGVQHPAFHLQQPGHRSLSH